MFIELIEVLRCPESHAESWLVAAFERAEGRVILEGQLGCPVCGAEYRITAGVAEFASGKDPAAAAEERAIVYDHWRIAALLDLRTPDALVVLCGGMSGAAPALCDLLPIRVLAINPGIELKPRERLGIVQAPGGIPLRTGVAAGVAVDGATPGLLADAVRVLRHGGRLLMPGEAAIPPGFTELARDEREVVAVKELDPGGVQLTRGPQATG